MTPAKVAHTVKASGLRIDVRRYADGRFGFDHHPPDGQRLKVRLLRLDDAIERARDLIQTSAAGELDVRSFNPERLAAFLRWESRQAKAAPVPALVTAFLKAKEGKGRSPLHLKNLRGDLGAFAATFSGSIAGISRVQVEEWLASRKVGPVRFNNLRTSIVALWRFARREGALLAEPCGAELVEPRRVRLKVATYTPDELRLILAAVPPQWLPVIVLGAFCGLRPQELRPEPRSGKPGLVWGNILWSKGKIDVPAAVAKTGRRRFAPLTDAAIAFLWARQGEPASARIAPQETPRFGQWGAVVGGWRKDALRHSFASYRLALTNDMAALALELGNSPSVIFDHYLDLQHEEEAIEWFGLRPKVPKVPSRAVKRSKIPASAKAVT